MKKILKNFPANLFLSLGLIDLILGVYYYFKLDESVKAGTGGLDNFLHLIFGVYLYGIATFLIIIIAAVSLLFAFSFRNIKAEEIFNKEASIVKKVFIVFSILMSGIISTAIGFFVIIGVATN